MGLIRRSAPTKTVVVERFTRREGGTLPPEGPGVHVMKSGPDGKIHENCWFCGEDIAWERGKEPGASGLIMFPLGMSGTPIETVCHSACAERAKGSLAKL
ncbi:MAG TPA: hypothetical protein VH063_04495 [Gaiellaceae bacterium]|jgi:hypothetical protein|nr:hypothetical protein [Gaiellaceae bacterium]